MTPAPAALRTAAIAPAKTPVVLHTVPHSEPDSLQLLRDIHDLTLVIARPRDVPNADIIKAVSSGLGKAADAQDAARIPRTTINDVGDMEANAALALAIAESAAASKKKRRRAAITTSSRFMNDTYARLGIANRNFFDSLRGKGVAALDETITALAYKMVAEELGDGFNAVGDSLYYHWDKAAHSMESRYKTRKAELRTKIAAAEKAARDSYWQDTYDCDTVPAALRRQHGATLHDLTTLRGQHRRLQIASLTEGGMQMAHKFLITVGLFGMGRTNDPQLADKAIITNADRQRQGIAALLKWHTRNKRNPSRAHTSFALCEQLFAITMGEMKQVVGHGYYGESNPSRLVWRLGRARLRALRDATRLLGKQRSVTVMDKALNEVKARTSGKDFSNTVPAEIPKAVATEDTEWDHHCDLTAQEKARGDAVDVSDPQSVTAFSKMMDRLIRIAEIEDKLKPAQIENKLKMFDGLYTASPFRPFRADERAAKAARKKGTVVEAVTVPTPFRSSVPAVA